MYEKYLENPNHQGKEIPRNILENEALSKLITSPILGILMAFTTGKDISFFKVAQDIDAIYNNVLDLLFIDRAVKPRPSGRGCKAQFKDHNTSTNSLCLILSV